MPLQIRRGTEADRTSGTSLTPQSGELIYITDTNQLYVGDGFTPIATLTPITGYTDENAVDALGSVFTVSAHSGISFTYNDVANTINAVVSQPSLLQNLNLNNFSITGTGNINIIGNITVDGKLDADFNGSIYGDDSTILVDGVDNKINLDGTVKGDIIPNANEVYDIGSPSLKFRDLYLSGTSLWLGGAQVTATGGVVNLPAGSTIGGNVILDTANEETAYIGDIQGSVFGDDSTLLVDALSSEIKGNINTSSLIVNKDSSEDLAVFNGITSGGVIPFVEINIAKNTLTEPTSLNPEDNIGGYRINAYANGEYKTVTALLSVLSADANISNDNPKTDAYLVVGNNTSSSFYLFQGNGIFKAPTAIKTGAFEDEAARDAAIPSPEAGMIIFLTGRDDSAGVPTFQGYDGTDWRDLST